MRDGRNRFYGIVNFNSNGTLDSYTIQIQCDKLVDFDKWRNGISVFLL